MALTWALPKARACLGRVPCLGMEGRCFALHIVYILLALSTQLSIIHTNIFGLLYYDFENHTFP